MTQPIEDLFTLQSIGTYAGASAAVVVLANTIRMLFRINSPWPAFLAALLVSGVGAWHVGAISNLVDIFIIILNACLLFCSALGMQETVIAATAHHPPKLPPAERKGVPWLSPWLPRDKSRAGKIFLISLLVVIAIFALAYSYLRWIYL